MSRQTIPANWKNCATCIHWCGQKSPDVFCKNVKFDNSERARCAGGGFNQASMGGTSSCGKWEPQYR